MMDGIFIVVEEDVVLFVRHRDVWVGGEKRLSGWVRKKELSEQCGRGDW